MRGHHRDRTVLPTGYPGDDRPALRPRGPGVLDRGQRLLASRSSLDRPDAPRLAECPPDPPTRARFLAGPGRDLLLRRPTQGRSPQRLHRPRSDPRTAGRIRDPLQRRRQTLQLEVHSTRAREPPPPHRHPRQPSPPPAASSLTTPEGLTGQTTKNALDRLCGRWSTLSV